MPVKEKIDPVTAGICSSQGLSFRWEHLLAKRAKCGVEGPALSFGRRRTQSYDDFPRSIRLQMRNAIGPPGNAPPGNKDHKLAMAAPLVTAGGRSAARETCFDRKSRRLARHSANMRPLSCQQQDLHTPRL